MNKKDKFTKLSKLVDLKEKGILTEEEFNKEKTTLLEARASSKTVSGIFRKVFIGVIALMAVLIVAKLFTVYKDTSNKKGYIESCVAEFGNKQFCDCRYEKVNERYPIGHTDKIDRVTHTTAEKYKTNPQEAQRYLKEQMSTDKEIMDYFIYIQEVTKICDKEVK